MASRSILVDGCLGVAVISGVVCISHTPLMHHSRAEPGVEQRFNDAVAKASRLVEGWEPDVTVLFFPDHLNGFFYGMMPQFCIGVRAKSIGDFGTIPGVLPIDEDLAVDCLNACISSGIDLAYSYRMSVDHGAAQPLELLSGPQGIGGLVPIFINCAAPPFPKFSRARALGAAVGQWASTIDKKVAIIASGGLSHDPPLPNFASASKEVQERLIAGGEQTHAIRLQRQSRVFAEARRTLEGNGTSRPLNPVWDRVFIDAALRGDLGVADSWDDERVTAEGGCGAHEVRTWIAGLSALTTASGPYQADLSFYEPVNEWLTATALVVATPATTEAKR